MQAQGLDTAALLAEHALAPRTVFDETARVSGETMASIFRRAVEVSGDPMIGLRAVAMSDARFIDFTRHVTDYTVVQAFANSDTVEAGLDRLRRFYPLAHDGVTFDWKRRGDRVDVVLTFADAREAAPALVELLVGALVRLVMSGGPIVPSSVSFRHRGPDDLTAYVALLGSVRFSADHDGFALPAATLSLPLETARPTLLAVVTKRAEAELARLEDGAFAARVRALLESETRGGNPSASRVADSLGISVRTLARKLKSAGTSHRTLLDTVRAERAHRLLVDERLPINEIATLLGFAEPSAFDRAFRRWFGRSPTAARREA